MEKIRVCQETRNTCIFFPPSFITNSVALEHIDYSDPNFITDSVALEHIDYSDQPGRPVWAYWIAVDLS